MSRAIDEHAESAVIDNGDEPVNVSLHSSNPPSDRCGPTSEREYLLPSDALNSSAFCAELPIGEPSSSRSRFGKSMKGKELGGGSKSSSARLLGDGETSWRPNFRTRISGAILSDAFANVSTGLVVINMVIMCMPYAGMTLRYEAVLEQASNVLTLLFALEMGLKLCVLGCSGYWAVSWNRLDGVVVLVSLMDFTLSVVLGSLGIKLSFLRILRMLRVVRVLRLMKAWKGLYSIVSTFIKALPRMSNVLILMCLGMTIFALFGMQLFGGVLGETRYHFDYFGPALITVFVLLTGNWCAIWDG